MVHLKERFKCTDCDKDFSDKDNMKAHRKRKHLSDDMKIVRARKSPKKVFCSLCSKELASDSLKSHMKAIHLGIKYPCPDCDYKATAEKSLKMHIETIHNGVRYKCTICGLEYSSKQYLGKHMKLAH